MKAYHLRHAKRRKADRPHNWINQVLDAEDWEEGVFYSTFRPPIPCHHIDDMTEEDWHKRRLGVLNGY